MNRNKFHRLLTAPLILVLAVCMLFCLFGCSPESFFADTAGTGSVTSTGIADTADAVTIDRHGYYYSKDDVSLYLYTYGELPPNFITKDEASELGWEGGSVEKYLDGAAIGGDRFGNREGLLPKKDGRVYYECDIDTNGASSRGAERIVYSNDGLIYYTPDHYESFVLLYGEE